VSSVFPNTFKEWMELKNFFCMHIHTYTLTQMGYYSALKKKKALIFNNMDKPGEHAKWNRQT
jgi:hypothetical protein